MNATIELEQALSTSWNEIIPAVVRADRFAAQWARSAATPARIEQAKHLLLNPHYSLEDIAEELGFRSVAQFTDMFEHWTGHLPTDYRLFWPGA
ncbi:MAG: helix-turn-helix domain-containing protein [Verrucomicrobiota bacterium]